MVLGTRYGIIGVSGYSGYSGVSGYSGAGTSGYSGYSGTSGYSGYSGENDHSLLSNLDYSSAGHSGFQKQLIWEPAYEAYLVE